ncbi:acetate/propionate family kinase [Paucibacter sp. DJ2R-2]|uniref:acetate/propionate family kinase n=1 Tax=Paucibacter sp. DJ2R-2 TaxID=2893558 RepID=UPI0021E3D3A0|nr:acetate/propionate family kinase [Paucibacter sp. DJ2R-2]MCV2419342.1 acetate/propionate family kinase [Paucibacter sp. DJ4R-1]MCV2437754.1 acetate/propionate family kinase [Paucibacter sp. DJ2R-2]
MAANDLLLTLNAGSSSLKFSLYKAQPELSMLAHGQVEGLGDSPRLQAELGAGTRLQQSLRHDAAVGDHELALQAILDVLTHHFHGEVLSAVSHRVVHGGPEFAAPQLIDAALLAQLERFCPLAPLHQPHNLAGIRAARAAFPEAHQVACFDTAFHRSHPFVADTFALPRRYYEQGIRRYGFHGLSYEFIARRLRELEPERALGRVVIAHLGNGASMCALRGGRSVASTMGFTALDGLPMGTRCGQLDPGVLLYLMSEHRMDPAALSDLLYKNAGLKGLSGESHDVRVLQASGSPAAREALAYFVDRGRRELAGLAACLGGLDALVLTGGIGENAAELRADLLADMEWMGLRLDPEANQRGQALISHPDSKVHIRVIKTDEERMLAEHAAELLWA